MMNSYFGTDFESLKEDCKEKTEDTHFGRTQKVTRLVFSLWRYQEGKTMLYSLGEPEVAAYLVEDEKNVPIVVRADVIGRKEEILKLEKMLGLSSSS